MFARAYACPQGAKREEVEISVPSLPLGDDLEEEGRKGEMAIGLRLLIPPSPPRFVRAHQPDSG